MSNNEKSSYQIKNGSITQVFDIIKYIGIFLALIKYSQDYINGSTSTPSNGLYSLFFIASYGLLLMLFIVNFAHIRDKSNNLYLFGVVLLLFTFVITSIFFMEYVSIMKLYFPEFVKIVWH